MPEKTMGATFHFLRNKPALAVAILLVSEIVLFYSIPTKEFIPTPPPLEQFSNRVGKWTMIRQKAIDEDTRDLLKADDTLTRDYVGPSNLELFVAFFKSQRAGVTPHSPRVCLPANGWTEESSRTVSIRVPGERSPIPVNRYVVTHQDQRKLVLYWYENPHRATANEYLSKFYLIYDAIRYRRSDEALVRVMAEVERKADAQAEEYAIQFIQDLYQPLKQQIWSAPSSAAVQPLSEDRR